MLLSYPRHLTNASNTTSSAQIAAQLRQANFTMDCMPASRRPATNLQRLVQRMRRA